MMGILQGIIGNCKSLQFLALIILKLQSKEGTYLVAKAYKPYYND